MNIKNALTGTYTIHMRIYALLVHVYVVVCIPSNDSASYFFILYLCIYNIFYFKFHRFISHFLNICRCCYMAISIFLGPVFWKSPS